MSWVWVCVVCGEFREWGADHFPMELTENQKIWLRCKECKADTIHEQMNEEGESVGEYLGIRTPEEKPV